MFKRLLLKLTRHLLERADLSLEERNELTSHLLDKMHALPIRDIITTNEEGNLLVNGHLIDMEAARHLRESAKAVLSNTAFKLIHERAELAAVAKAFHNSVKIEDLFFGKSAVWFGQLEVQFLKELAQEAQERELGP